MAKRNNSSSNEQFTVYHLSPQHAGQTLAGVLKEWVAGASWGQAQNWVRQRFVQVNGNLCCDPARRLTEKDVVKLWREPLAKPITAEQLRLPYIDEHLLVVEKPAGITSVWHREERQMPDKRRHLQPTLEQLLSDALGKELGLPFTGRARREKSPGAGPGKRPVNKGLRHRNAPTNRWPVYPVHRLDRDTSGLMVFARTRMAEQKLIGMFRDHLVQRQYWAVAHGQVASQTIRSLLVRDRGDGLRGSVPALIHTGVPNGDPVHAEVDEVVVDAREDSSNSEPAKLAEANGAEPEAQEAVTHVEHVETLGSYSIIRCRLETGRTHQIRIHLSEQGHPLCGEKMYVRLPDGQLLVDVSQAPRQALHAERLNFVHPITGEKLNFQMTLPPDLKSWLKRLRTDADASNT